jgi:hypothetical protein
MIGSAATIIGASIPEAIRIYQTRVGFHLFPRHSSLQGSWEEHGGDHFVPDGSAALSFAKRIGKKRFAIPLY